MRLPTRVERIEFCLAESGRLRRQIANLAKTFVTLHDYSVGSDEGSELMKVICKGEDYQATLQAIMDQKKA